MRESTTVRRVEGLGTRRWLGAGVLVAIAIQAWLKSRADIAGEMLWICYPAGAMVGIGVLFRLPRVAAVGFVFHLGMGFIGWGLDAIAVGWASPISIAVHVLPLVAGAAEARASGVWRGAPFVSWGAWLALQAIARVATDPALNVNLAHSIWPPFAPWFSSMTAYTLFNAALAIPFLATAYALARLISHPFAPTVTCDAGKLARSARTEE